MVAAKKQVAKKSAKPAAKKTVKPAAKSAKGGDKGKSADKPNAGFFAKGPAAEPKKKALIPLREGRAVVAGETEIMVPLDQIDLDETQTRAALDMETVDRYAALMADGVDFPAAILMQLASGRKAMVAGFHRFHGRRKAGFTDIKAVVRTGTLNQAIMQGACDNATHGLNMTRADKQRAIRMYLEAMVAEGLNESDREIARKMGVDHKTVAAHREELLRPAAAAGAAESGETPQTELNYAQRVAKAATADECRKILSEVEHAVEAMMRAHGDMPVMGDIRPTLSVGWLPDSARELGKAVARARRTDPPYGNALGELARIGALAHQVWDARCEGAEWDNDIILKPWKGDLSGLRSIAVQGAEKRADKNGVLRTVAVKAGKSSVPAPLYTVGQAVRVRKGKYMAEWGTIVGINPAASKRENHVYEVKLDCMRGGQWHPFTEAEIERPVSITKCAPAKAEGSGNGSTIHVPGRPGKDLGQLERGGGDEGATAGEDTPLRPWELYTNEQINATVQRAFESTAGAEARLAAAFRGNVEPTNDELLKLAGELLGEYGGGCGGAGRLDYARKGGAKPRVVVGSMMLSDSKVGLVIEGVGLARRMREIWGGEGNAAGEAGEDARGPRELTEDVILEAVRNCFLMMPEAGPKIHAALKGEATDARLLMLAQDQFREEGGTSLSNGMEASFNGDPEPVICIFASQDEEDVKPLLVLEGPELAARMRAAFAGSASPEGPIAVGAEYVGKRFDWEAFTRDAKYVLKTLDVLKTYRPEKEYLAEALRITGHIGLEAGKLFDLFRDLAASQGITNEVEES